jgi:hypothetical protein
MFSLSKWYCDCVTDDGAAVIGYWARLSWGPLAIPYGALLLKPEHGQPRARYLMRSCQPPVLDDGRIGWNAPRLGLSGHWQARVPGVRQVLLDSSAGSIVWNCHAPCADAAVQVDGGAPLYGLGYAEHLTMTVRPWRLPIDELRWGRFMSPEHSLTWIEWRGGAPRSWVLHNGREAAGATIGAGGVSLRGGRGSLSLQEPVILRDGRLALTALRALPAARLWMPGGLAGARETKWLAKGIFTAGSRVSAGWAIHEVVRMRG